MQEEVEETMMNRKEHSKALRADTQVHYNCAQSVLIPFAQDMGLSQEQANAMTVNFGAGMGCGSVCGAITGAMLAMGGLGMSPEKRGELLREFRRAHGDVNCAQLLKSAAERGEERKCHCDRMVEWCMDWVSGESGLE